MSVLQAVLADVATTSTDLPFWGGEATTSYKLLFVVHMAAIIAAFGPLFVSAALNREAMKRTGDEAAAFASIPLKSATASFPALMVAVLAGIGLILDSQDRYTFEQSWVSASFSVVIVLVLVYLFMLIPAQKRLVAAVQTPQEEGGENKALRSAKAVVGMATGFVHLGMLVLIGLMIWKPGL